MLTAIFHTDINRLKNSKFKTVIQTLMQELIIKIILQWDALFMSASFHLFVEMNSRMIGLLLYKFIIKHRLLLYVFKSITFTMFAYIQCSYYTTNERHSYMKRNCFLIIKGIINALRPLT